MDVFTQMLPADILPEGKHGLHALVILLDTQLDTQLERNASWYIARVAPEILVAPVPTVAAAAAAGAFVDPSKL